MFQLSGLYCSLLLLFQATFNHHQLHLVGRFPTALYRALPQAPAKMTYSRLSVPSSLGFGVGGPAGPSAAWSKELVVLCSKQGIDL